MYTSHFLLEEPESFQLKPDLLVGSSIIADTKWKVLDSSVADMKISQSDLYQMYAYGKKYSDAEEIWLIYPFTEELESSFGREYSFDGELKLRILGFDCIEGELVGVEIESKLAQKPS